VQRFSLMMIPTFSKSWRQLLYHARHADAEAASLASPRPGSTSTIATSTPRRTLYGKIISTRTLQDRIAFAGHRIEETPLPSPKASERLRPAMQPLATGC